MSRIRSPNYPQLSLQAALDRVSRIFGKEHRHPAPREIVVQHLGYKGLNGASAGVISALLKYGLLEQQGDDVRVSDRAIAILHPGSDQEKQEALVEAARSPALFSEILENYGGRLPSDENLKSFLIRRGFSQNALTGVIDVLRDTMAFVGDGASTPAALPVPAPAVRAAPAPARAVPVAQDLHQPAPPAQKKMSVALEDDMLRVSAVLSDQIEVARLIQILTANKVLLPESRHTGSSEKITDGDEKYDDSES